MSAWLTGKRRRGWTRARSSVCRWHRQLRTWMERELGMQFGSTKAAAAKAGTETVAEPAASETARAKS